MKSTTVFLWLALLAGPAFASGELEEPAAAPAQVGAGQPGAQEPDVMPPEALEEGQPDDPVVREDPLPPVPPGAVARAVFTSEVVDREPTDELDQLTTDYGRVYFFTELVGVEGYTLTHRWQYGGEVIAEVPFEIGGPRWRVYSSKDLLPGWIGEWTVTVVDASGNVLAQHTLEYLQPVPAAPAPGQPGEAGTP